MIMENVVFVYVDKPRIDAFMELLTEDGYTDRSPNATDKKRLVFESIQRKSYLSESCTPTELVYRWKILLICFYDYLRHTWLHATTKVAGNDTDCPTYRTKAVGGLRLLLA